MKLEGDYELEAGVQEVWDALFDPAVLAAAMPGCDKLELVDGAYLGELKVKVGPVQGKFSGKVDLLDKVEPKSYRMVVDGRGAQGFVKANATIELEAVEGSGGGKTKLRYQSDAQIGGKLATVGMRLVEASAKAIVKQSLEGLNENVKIRAAAYREKAAAESSPSTPPVEPASAVEEARSAGAEAEDKAEEIEAKAEAKAEETEEKKAEEKKAEEKKAEEKKAEEKKAEEKKIEYKRADAGKMATAVAKEVGKTMAPTIIAVVVVAALLVYLLLLR